MPTSLDVRLPRLSSRAAAGSGSGGAFLTSDVPLAEGGITLTGGFPGPDLLPVAELAEAYATALARPNAAGTALQYHSALGYDPLRAWVAEREGVELGQVLITNGAGHGIDLVFEALLDAGDVVVVENPTYPFALRGIAYHGARVVGVGADEHGLDVDSLEARLEQGLRPRLVYVIPDFQNPSGVTLSAERRARLVALAELHGFLVLSDNPYTELRFAGEHVAPFTADTENVVRAGSFSKVLGPGLRLGWLVAPPWLHPALVRVRMSQDQLSGVLTQHAVTELVQVPGRFDAIVERAREGYRERATVLFDGLRAHLGERLVAQRPEGGLFVWGSVPGVDVRAALDLGRAGGVDFIVGPSFDPDRSGTLGQHFRAAYSASSVDRLAVASERLADALLRAPAA